MAFMIEEKKGDLFKGAHSTVSLAHCISVDLRMGKGIALMFKKLFGGINELQRQKVQVGGVGVLEKDGRFIYYLITKQGVYDTPTYTSLRSSLCAMRDHCVSHSVHHLAMPRIGCGLDNLQWPQVLQEIKDVFKDTNLTITVYTLD